MRGNVDGDSLAIDLFGFEPRLKIIQGGLRAGGNRQVGRVDRAQIKMITQQGFQLIGGQGNGQHATLGHRVKERTHIR